MLVFQKTCEICGMSFSGTEATKYCSRECLRKAMKKRYREQYWQGKRSADGRKAVEAVCFYCGKTFRKSETSPRRFCTRECNELHQSGIPFRPPPKSYAEIKAANRAAKVESGWRGRKVSGGGAIKNRHGLMVADC
jgi:hypothetical protein